MVSVSTNTSGTGLAIINKIASIVMKFLMMLDMTCRQGKMSKPKLGEEKPENFLQSHPRMILMLHAHQFLKISPEHQFLKVSPEHLS